MTNPREVTIPSTATKEVQSDENRRAARRPTEIGTTEGGRCHLCGARNGSHASRIQYPSSDSTRGCHLVAAIALLLVVPHAAARATTSGCPANLTLQVSTTADPNSADGSQAHPYRTITAAVQRARSLRSLDCRQPITIRVAPGIYKVMAKFNLPPEPASRPASWPTRPARRGRNGYLRCASSILPKVF